MSSVGEASRARGGATSSGLQERRKKDGYDGAGDEDERRKRRRSAERAARLERKGSSGRRGGTPRPNATLSFVVWFSVVACVRLDSKEDRSALPPLGLDAPGDLSRRSRSLSLVAFTFVNGVWTLH